MKAFKQHKVLRAQEPGRMRSGGSQVKNERSTKRPGPSHSMYSTSTESSDQVQGAHNDLDRCARVLSEILDNDHGILDAIKKKARCAVSARCAPSKVPFKKRQGNAKKCNPGRAGSSGRGGRGGSSGPVGSAWSSTPEKKPAGPPAAASDPGHLQHRAAAPGVPFSDEERENPRNVIVTNMSALDSPTQRIRRLRNNEVRRALDELQIPVPDIAANRATALPPPPPPDDATAPGMASRSTTRRWLLDGGRVGSGSSNSSCATSEADTLRGVHLENSSQFGVPPVFSATAVRSRFGRTDLLVAATGPKSHPSTIASVPLPARWESDGSHKNPSDTVLATAQSTAPSASSTSAALTDAALPVVGEQGKSCAAAAATAAAAAAPDVGLLGRTAAGEPWRPCLPSRAWEPSSRDDSPGADESGNTTLVTSILEAADCSPPMDEPPPPSSLAPAAEACHFRLRYLVHEISTAANSADLRRLAADLEQAVETLMQMSQPAVGCRESSTVLSENILLRNRVKLLETRLANVKATADDHLELRCAAYEAQVSKMEILMTQLERTIFEERHLLQQAKDEISEQQKHITDLQSERTRMIHALAFKDECYSKLKQQCAADEAQYTAWGHDLQLGAQSLEHRLLGCTDELREARLSTERLASSSRAALDLLINLTSCVDRMPNSDPWKIPLQEQVSDIRCQLLRGCFDKHLPPTEATPRSRAAYHPSAAAAAQSLPTVSSSPSKKSIDFSLPARSAADLVMQGRQLVSPAASGGLPSRPAVSGGPRRLAAGSRMPSQPATPAEAAADAERGSAAVNVHRALPRPDVTAVSGLLAHSGRCLSPSSVPPDLQTQQLQQHAAGAPAPAAPSAAAGTLLDLSSTRYSITEYFRKYHPPTPGDGTECAAPLVAPHSRSAAAAAEASSRGEDVPRAPIYRSAPAQAATEDAGNRLDRSLCLELSLSDTASTDGGLAASSPTPATAVADSRQLSQYESFAGTALDTSQSTIASDSASVISTTTSVADSAFKQGLELLDANIARLQQQLRSSLRK